MGNKLERIIEETDRIMKVTDKLAIYVMLLHATWITLLIASLVH